MEEKELATKQKLHVFLKADDNRFSFAERDFARFTGQHPDVEVQLIESEQELLASLDDIVWLDTWHFSPEWYALAPRLKGVFTPAAGRENVAQDPAARVPVHYGTFHGVMMAESALAMILHFSANLHRYHHQQADKVWQRIPSRRLSSQTALVVGYGHIGKQCGRLLDSLGMTVWGHQRQPTESHDGQIELISQAQLDDYLPRADHIISFLPGDSSTRRFFSAGRLARLSPSAYLYNFGRGTTIDETALIDALQSGKIAGAGLDVTEIEPLPLQSALWELPGVMLLPHASAYYEEYRQLHVTELTETAFSLLSNKSKQ